MNMPLRNSSIYANRVIERLIQRSEQIGFFPRSGRMVPEYRREDIREAIERPYRIIYRLAQEEIHVLALIHSAQNIPPEVPD